MKRDMTRREKAEEVAKLLAKLPDEQLEKFYSGLKIAAALFGAEQAAQAPKAS